MNHLTELQISYSHAMPKSQRTKIKDSKQSYASLLEIWNADLIELQEQFFVLFLNHANEIIGFKCLFIGGMSSTIVDVKLIYSMALKCCASGIIVAHNHPSGGLIPSRQDINITNKLKEAGRLLDISLLDHLIITKDGYYSFADEGSL